MESRMRRPFSIFNFWARIERIETLVGLIQPGLDLALQLWRLDGQFRAGGGKNGRVCLLDQRASKP
jgi:hypothetical protein